MTAKLIEMLDRIHAAMDDAGDMPSFDEIGCLIAEAKGEYTPEET